MFTGIVEELGLVVSPGSRLEVGCRLVRDGLREGASVAVNGVCLTVIALQSASFTVDLSPETLERSNLGDLRTGSPVNLERALKLGDRLDGHLVQGHIDGTAELVELRESSGGNWWLTVRAPAELLRYLVFKGSVALDGISLTIADLEDDRLSVAVIPFTYRNTTLRVRRPGDRLNLECDLIAKYVEKMLGGISRPRAFPSLDELKEMGY